MNGLAAGDSVRVRLCSRGVQYSLSRICSSHLVDSGFSCNEDTGAVLMVHEDGEWDLPHFVYPKPLSYNVHCCCGDLRRFLGIESDDVFFAVRVELRGVLGYEGKNEVRKRDMPG